MLNSPDAIPFSKARLEALSDGVFAIAMTLLVLELKVPEIERSAPAAAAWAALGHEALGYIGFFLSFVLGSQFWLQQHVMFHYVKRADRLFTLLTLLFLMFVSLLPYSTNLLTHFGLRQTVGELWYFGNQWILSVVLALKWAVAQRRGLLDPDPDDLQRRQFGFLLYGLPVALLIPIAMSFYAPRQAVNSMGFAFLFAIIVTKKLAAQHAAAATS